MCLFMQSGNYFNSQYSIQWELPGVNYCFLTYFFIAVVGASGFWSNDYLNSFLLVWLPKNVAPIHWKISINLTSSGNTLMTSLLILLTRSAIDDLPIFPHHQHHNLILRRIPGTQKPLMQQDLAQKCHMHLINPC